MPSVTARLLRLLVVLASVASPLAVFAAPPPQRTFVSGSGLDSNPCSLALPCRGFPAAVAAVADGGEVVVLDSAGYGPVAITKSVSIIAPPGVYAGISVFSGDGVTLSTAGLAVSLKGLTITGLGGANGIHMTAGAGLRIEDCTVTGFGATNTSAGINISAAADIVISNTSAVGNYVGILLDGGANVQISNSNIDQNALVGVLLDGPSNATTLATVSESVVSGNAGCGLAVLGQGVFTGGFAACTSCTRKMTVVNSTASGNGSGVCQYGNGGTTFVSGTVASMNGSYGFHQFFGGTLYSAQNNPLTGNGAGPTSGTITTGGVLY